MFLARLRGASERLPSDPQEPSGLGVETEQSDGPQRRPQRRPRSGGQTSEPGGHVRLRRETQAGMCNGVRVAFCVHE